MKRKIDEVKSIRILKSRNGVALIAVLGVLLVLTVLLPTMFSMSEVATMEAAKGTDKQRASYLARTNLEMSVAAFEDIYNCAFGADANLSEPVSYTISGKTNPKAADVKVKFTPFFEDLDETTRITKHPIDMGYVIMYEDPSADKSKTGGTDIKYMSVTGISTKKQDPKFPDDATKQIDKTYEDLNDDFKGMVPSGTTYIGFSTCNVVYDASIDHYKINQDTGEATKIEVSEFNIGWNKMIEYLKSKDPDDTPYDSKGYQYTKIENRNVVFTSTAYINGKLGSRKCVLVLPTEPSDQEWIVPASVGSNQVFPNTSKATGVVPLDYNTVMSKLGDNEDEYVRQPLYTFSCLGNMRITFDDLKDPEDSTKLYSETHPEIMKDLSFGLFPEVGTIPENDPTFSCLRAYNMESWYATDAQKDNFVAFTATNIIECDCPISLFVNPCRTDRLGDGVAIKIGNFIDVGDKNHSLYKVMMFQAPTIYFKDKVECMVSLYTPPASKNDEARRMSTVVLSAPQSTPYSYINAGRDEKTGAIKEKPSGTLIPTTSATGASKIDGKVVKAGKVFFAQDVYIWIIPYLENGSPYSEHWYELSNTVYYKSTDMKCYKLANAGDVYYFNSEVTTDKGTNMGFSLSGYFLDVIYPQYSSTLGADVGWWQVWSKAKGDIFNHYMETYTDKNYCAEDLYFLGNVGDNGTTQQYPRSDDYYIVWDS